MIEVTGISKSFGRKKVLDNITFKVEPNNICCLLGKNGAGKSTLINIITQSIKQDEGRIIINDKEFSANTILVKEKIGLVSEANDLIQELTGFQFLAFRSLIFYMPEEIFEQRAKELVHYFFESSDDIYKQVSSYSAGMKMKLKIIASLLHAPQILIMDEPFANLDPLASEKLVILLSRFAQKDGNMVLLSSHDLMYAEKVATQICVLNDMQMVFNGSKTEFTENNGKKIDASLLAMIGSPEINTQQISWLV